MYVSKMENTNLDHGRNSHLDDYTYDILLLETIHFNTISMKGNFKLLSAASLLFKNSWLVYQHTDGSAEPGEKEWNSIAKV